MKKQRLKLNLGCGNDILSGWVNIDAVPEVHPDVVHDLLQKLPFQDGSAEEVKAQDILEHFTYQDVDFVISEISRVLCEGGRIKLRVPNVDQIIAQFEKYPWTRNHFLYGNTSETGVFGAHKMGFTPEVLLVKMMNHNLYPVSLKNVQTNYEAIFVKQKKTRTKQNLIELPSIQLSFQYFRKVVREFQKADVLVIEDFVTKIILSPIPFVMGIPVIWYESSSLDQIFKKYLRLPKLLYRLVKEIPSLVVLSHQNFQNVFLNNTRIDLCKIRVLNKKDLTKHKQEIVREVLLLQKAKEWLKANTTESSN